MEPEEILRRADNIKKGERKVRTDMRFVRPLSSLGDEIRSRAEKIHTGITSIDRKLNGLRVGEFAIVGGLPHHGKSLLAQTLVYNNPALPVLYVSPDESRAKVLAQMAAAHLNLSYHEDIEPVLEERTADDQPTPACEEMLDDITCCIREEFPLFTVVGAQRLGITDLGVAMDEATEATGHVPKLLIFDYMSQLSVPGQDTPNGRPDALKAFASVNDVAVLAVHQIRKLYNPMDCMEPDQGMLAMGGEQQAFQILWCAREALVDQSCGGAPEERQPKVRIFILKNKNGKLMMEGKDCAINPVTGIIEDWCEAHSRRRRGQYDSY